jgi:hypothetical protein
VVEAARAAAEVVAADKAWEAVLRLDRAVIAFVPIAVKRHPINSGNPVMSRNVPSAGQP